MPGYRRVRFVDRPTYYTNTPGDPGPVFVGTMSSYFYKVSEVVAAITPNPFAAELNQWYVNDTGASINYTNNTGSFVQVFIYNPTNKLLHIDRIMANGTKGIDTSWYFAIYNTAEQSVPIIDMLGQIMFEMVDTNGETNDARYRGIKLNGTNYLYLTYKRYTPPTPADPENRRIVATGFQIQALYDARYNTFTPFEEIDNLPTTDFNEQIDDYLNQVENGVIPTIDDINIKREN